MYMTYEQVEERIEAINDELLKINNEIVEANWIIKNVAKTKRLEAKVKQLIDENMSCLNFLNKFSKTYVQTSTCSV